MTELGLRLSNHVYLKMKKKELRLAFGSTNISITQEVMRDCVTCGGASGSRSGDGHVAVVCLPSPSVERRAAEQQLYIQAALIGPVTPGVHVGPARVAPHALITVSDGTNPCVPHVLPRDGRAHFLKQRR